jgi:hypothetical protein
LADAGGETGTGEAIARLAQDLRARQALGRSESLNRLFDYLAESAAAGARPKEFEVAAAVFGRDAAFDGAQDASVRVAVHRLRRKLDDFYAGPGRDDPERLSIPKGEYRMIAEPRPAAAPPARAPRWPPWAIAAAALVVLNLAVWAVFWGAHRGDSDVTRARANAPWSDLGAGDGPTLLVLGDYYIFGEIDEQAGINRLVRQYSINSAADLDDWLMDNPKAMGKYRDLDLYYLPVGAAFALRAIAPIVSHRAPGHDTVRVVMSSDLTPEMLKHSNIVYLGYLSGLGVLKAPVFAASRFQVGETYDELVDTRTHRPYLSQAGRPAPDDANRRDYGYVTAFRGPSGNRIVIVAGARDSGLQEAAEALADPDELKALRRAVAGADSFEALYETEGIGRSSLAGKRLFAGPRTAVNPWTAQPQLSFPAG